MNPSRLGLVVLGFALAACSLAGDITPPPALGSAQAAQSRPSPAASGNPAPQETPTGPPDPRAGASISSPEAGKPEPAPIPRVSGSVINGTLGGQLPASLKISLLGFDGDTQVLTQSARTDARGNFEFAGIERAPGRLYAVTAEYGGVSYASKFAHLPEGESTLDLSLRIYETTPETASVRVERLHVLYDFAVPGRVSVVELWVLSNLGDRTIATSDGRGLLEFELPEGATGLSFEEDPEGSGRFVPSTRGFVDTDPLLPGRGTSQVVFGFDLSYERELDFAQPTDLPVDAVVILIPEGGPQLEAEGLQDMGVREMGGARLRNYALGPLAAGEHLAIRLSGRPASFEAAGGFPWANLAIGVGALGIAVIVAGLWWFRSLREGTAEPRRGRTQAHAHAVEEEKNRLIQAMADLDDEFEAGLILEAAYRQRREGLKRRALPLMRDEGD